MGAALTSSKPKSSIKLTSGCFAAGLDGSAVVGLGALEVRFEVLASRREEDVTESELDR